ncbi:MAG TPA: class II fructose-bisphosphate aldolase [Ktedonobacteraceae bacterium]|nr:class II fructose-bisphosphate aldolase [Ktedonobacteraceae bacterium]
MLASFTELLHLQQQRGAALGAFTCYTFETAVAAVQAAHQEQSGIILLISEKSFAAPQGAYLVASLRAIAEQAPVPVCLQLDHVSDLAQIERACQSGLGSIMADGSRLPFEENIAFVSQAVASGRRYGVEIEAELGRVEGNEDIASAAQAGLLTDPAQAALFVERAQPACLAVSIGNIHGIYQHPPALDWERLSRLRQAIPLPLSLHGASGLPDEDLRQAISLGIAKVNVNTELRASYFDLLQRQLATFAPGLRQLELQHLLIEAQSQVCQSKLQLST